MTEVKIMPFTIYAESTPNPASMKFVANKMIIDDKPREYLDIDTAKESPLAIHLFQMPFVKSVFISNNYITINKTNLTEWEEVSNELRLMIASFLNEGNLPLNKLPEKENKLNTSIDQSINQELTSEIDQKISAILDEYIRPAVEQDGGAIQFKSFKNGVVTVILKGACSGCPSASLTLKSGIEQLLKRLIPDVKEVIADEV